MIFIHEQSTKQHGSDDALWVGSTSSPDRFAAQKRDVWQVK